MLNKKNILIIGICVFCCSVISGLSEDDFNGIWIDYSAYNYLVSSHDTIKKNGLVIQLSEKDKYFYDYRYVDISSFYFEGKSLIVDSVVYGAFVGKSIFTKTDDDVMSISGWTTSNPDSEVYKHYWYRISSPAKIPVKDAVVNDYKVRIRTKPSLSCDTWGYLNKNDFVKIKDKSAEQYEINGESWYWYKVESKNLPDGWVYGKYLDIEE